jgi:hypothetical protein
MENSTKQLRINQLNNEELKKDFSRIDINKEIFNFEIEKNQVNDLDLAEANLISLKLDFQKIENNLNKNHDHLLDLEKDIPNEIKEKINRIPRINDINKAEESFVEKNEKKNNDESNIQTQEAEKTKGF